MGNLLQGLNTYIREKLQSNNETQETAKQNTVNKNISVDESNNISTTSNQTGAPTQNGEPRLMRRKSVVRKPVNKNL